MPLPSTVLVNSYTSGTTFVLEEPSSVTSLQPEKKTETRKNSSSNCFDVCEFDKFTYVEDCLTEILTLDNADPRYKKLRDEMVEDILHDLKRNALPKEGIQTRLQPQVLVLLGKKKAFLFLCAILFIAVLAMLFYTSDDDCRLVPT
ncbi:transmembrane protein, putative [Medicago truncatula]|nr:transmembrane protein, putative [Medicago truncatula]